MCGFAGVIAWDEKYRVTRDTLEKMSRAIAHRGPDGEGFHLTRENEPITPDSPQVGLAFRRLAILDPDPRSNQPFHIGPLTLVFNGEIYNFRDLKSEISKLRPDYQWRTTGDTEVLLMAYEVWRDKCVEKLNGMFAFAVWDEQKKQLFLARDRMGQKPLFLAQTLQACAIASEPSALMRLGWVDAQPHDIMIREYLQVGYNQSTICAGISCIAPGHMTSIGKVELSRKYFDLTSLKPQCYIDEVAVIQTRRLVTQAVGRQLVSDVPLGVFLSGGVDSSVIAAAARQSGKVKTFCVSFDDPRYDESIHAQAVADHLGIEHQVFHVTAKAATDLANLANVFGTPFADSSALPVHYLSRETRCAVKVALGGDGGDELFGGYDRYRAVLLAKRLSILGSAVTSRIGRWMGSSHPKSKRARFGRFSASLNQPPGKRYESYMRLFDDQTIAELILHPSTHERAWNLALLFEAFRQGRDDVQAALALDRITYLPNDLLTKVDRCSMLHGLEVRSPFMDHELVQFAAGLTTDQLLKGGPKRMLREAFAKDLPDFVFKRKKMGFAVPIGEWFRGELKPMLRENLYASNSFGKSHFNMKVVERLVDEHETQRVDHSQRLYALLMLELWWQQQKR